MKKLLLAVLLVCLPLSVAVTQTGCVTTPRTVAYNTLKATAVTVDNAYMAFWDLVVAGKVPTDTQAKVQSLRAKYQAAFASAVVLAKFDYNTATPADVGILASDLVNTIATLVK